MLTSFVILNWNRAEDTEQAVDSVLRQKGELEVLIWDNASSDGSPERLKKKYAHEPRVRLLPGDANYGVAGGRNRAFREARGELLFSLDSDAMIDGDQAIECIQRAFRNNPKLGALSFEVKRPDGHLMWPFSRKAASWRNQSFLTIRVDGCAFVATREAFDATGGFAEHFSPYGAEDQYFAFQLVGLGYDVLYLPTVSVVHAYSPHGRQGRQFAMHVRNMLWMPLELFPMPQALLSAGKSIYWLIREAAEQKQWGALTAGLWQAAIGFRPSRRKPMSRAAWKHLRSLRAEDKAAADGGAAKSP